jgi:hypothetical protein
MTPAIRAHWMEVNARTDLTMSAKVIFGILLLYHRNWKTWRCFPQQELLAKEAGTSLATVKRALAQLKKAGVLRWKSGHSEAANEYNFPGLAKVKVEVPVDEVPLGITDELSTHSQAVDQLTSDTQTSSPVTPDQLTSELPTLEELIKEHTKEPLAHARACEIEMAREEEGRKEDVYQWGTLGGNLPILRALPLEASSLPKETVPPKEPRSILIKPEAEKMARNFEGLLATLRGMEGTVESTFKR